MSSNQAHNPTHIVTYLKDGEKHCVLCGAVGEGLLAECPYGYTLTREGKPERKTIGSYL